MNRSRTPVATVPTIVAVVVVAAGLALVAGCACGPPWQGAVDGFNRSVDDAIVEVSGKIGAKASERAVRRLQGWRAIVRPPPPPPPTLQRTELVVADRWGRHRGQVAAVAAVFAGRFDLDALPSTTPLSVWTLGDDVVAAEVHRDDDDGGPVLAAPAFLADPGGSGRMAFYDDDGAALDGPFMARPVAWRTVSSRCGPRANPFTGKPNQHRGVDLVAATGTPVVSVGDGVVVVAGFNKTAGNHVVVRHKGGLVTRYFHLDAIAVDVVAGTKIKRGQGVGVVGATGAATGPHLHFEVVKAGGLTDPLRLEWPAGPLLPKAQRTEHLALVAQLRAMPAGLALLAWPDPQSPQTAPADPGPPGPVGRRQSRS